MEETVKSGLNSSEQLKLNVLLLNYRAGQDSFIQKLEDFLRSQQLSLTRRDYESMSAAKALSLEDYIAVLYLAGEEAKLPTQLRMSSMSAFPVIYIQVDTAEKPHTTHIKHKANFTEMELGQTQLQTAILQIVTQQIEFALRSGNYEHASTLIAYLAEQDQFPEEAHLATTMMRQSDAFIQKGDLKAALRTLEKNAAPLKKFNLSPSRFVLQRVSFHASQLVAEKEFTKAQSLLESARPHLHTRVPGVTMYGFRDNPLETLSANLLDLIDKVEDELHKQYQQNLDQVTDFLFKGDYDGAKELLENIKTTQPKVSLAELVEQVQSSTSKEKVQFTMYAPSTLKSSTRHSVIIYAHKPEESFTINKDSLKFSDELGETPKKRTTPEPIAIPRKTPITIIPEAEGIEFDPPQLTKVWDSDWLRFAFDFKPAYKESEIWIRVSIRLQGIEIASLKASCEVIAPFGDTRPANPLVKAKQRGNLQSVAAAPHRHIFISYSHADETIALKRAEKIEQVLGDQVFIDVKSLRAGDDWEYQLAKAIDDADIFHLLWSENTAQSEYCRYEWDYALNHKCPENRCVGVIRPIYWKKPMPANPPDELKHLHFEYVDMSDILGMYDAN